MITKNLYEIFLGVYTSIKNTAAKNTNMEMGLVRENIYVYHFFSNGFKFHLWDPMGAFKCQGRMAD